MDGNQDYYGGYGGHANQTTDVYGQPQNNFDMGGFAQHDYSQYAQHAGTAAGFAQDAYGKYGDQVTQHVDYSGYTGGHQFGQEESYYAEKFGETIVNNPQTTMQVLSVGAQIATSGPSQDFLKQQTMMQMSKGGEQVTPQSLSAGICNSYKDLLGLRKLEPPEIEVCEPTIKTGTASKHHVYKVRGRDHLGEFEVYRRFSNFDQLRKVLYSRFLGLYVPPIPEKKAMGNKESLFIEERLYFLDRFMKEIAQLPYLYESEELQAFLRPTAPNADVERSLELLPRLTTDDLLKRFRTVMPVNESAGDIKLKSHNEGINEFVRDCREYLEQLKGFKKHVKTIVPIKEAEVTYYKQFVDFLVKYEETNNKKQRPGDPNLSLLTGEGRIDLKSQLETTANSIGNPFKHIRNWIKGEIMELHALLECISRKEGIESSKSKAISKVKDNKDTVDKMNTGKFTLKGLFKSSSGKAAETQNILQSISQTEIDIQNYEVIKNFLIIYLAEIAIPAFKVQKVQNYVQAMARFSNQEISNSRLQGDCWGDFLASVKASCGKQHINIK